MSESAFTKKVRDALASILDEEIASTPKQSRLFRLQSLRKTLFGEAAAPPPPRQDEDAEKRARVLARLHELEVERVALLRQLGGADEHVLIRRFITVGGK